MSMGTSFSKMFDFSNYNTDSSEDSDSPYYQSEDSVSDASSDYSTNNSGSATFDSYVNVPIKKYHSSYKVSSEDINEIEKELDLYEYISLIFLLIDNTSYALQVIRSLVAAGPENFSKNKLYEWTLTSPDKWKYKLFEALAIIQNNKSLIKLGFCKEDINVMRDAPVYINRFKKVLYSFVCDFLNLEQAQDIIARVRCDAKFKEDITLHCDAMYIEFHILFWIDQDYISIERKPYLDRLIKHFKFANLLDVCTKLNEETITLTKSTIKNTEKSKVADDEEEDYYKIRDPNNPGLVVVVNNFNFSNNIESREEFKNKLPYPRLSDRKGSEKDVASLKKTFEDLNYKVVVRNDIPHDKMVDVIYDTVRNEFIVDQHSVLVLCVLSHGAKGVIFGVNSIPVENEEIINSVSGSSSLITLLAGLPKVIIIQACQGDGILYAEPEHDLLEPDGPLVADGGNANVDGLVRYDPKDKVVCMATIKGFVALRSPACGSKYIQEICRCIKKYHRKKHFLDIMTKVQKNLSSEKSIVKTIDKRKPICMIPEITSSLCKSLYLTPKQLPSARSHSASRY